MEDPPGLAGASGSSGPDRATTGGCRQGSLRSLSGPVAVTGRRVNRRDVTIALLFLLPATLMLVVWIVYPVVYTVWRSLYDAAGSHFVGLAKYHLVAENSSTR